MRIREGCILTATNSSDEKEQYKKAYGVAIERGWKDSLFDCGENEEEEI